ncbi:MAG TPA: hypothetical protein VN610_10060 [Bryobacteraceae bacterium]|nr:hypothetical protein [Bryobacteraceae bacterium]
MRAIARAYVLVLSAVISAGLAMGQAPAIASGGVVNGASFEKGQPIAPGSLFSIFGTQLASKTAQADSIPLSTSLGGVSVQFVSGSTTFNAPLLFVQPGAASQINAQVPWELASGTVNVVVTRDGVASAPAPVTIGAASPAIFSSSGRAVAVNTDGSLAWPAGAVAGANSHPAKPGDVITIYASGLGPVDSPVADGQNSLDKLRHTQTMPVVMVGGMGADVLFAGLSPQFVGVNQLNVKIPNVAPGDAVPLQIQIGGVTSSASLTIAIGQ